MSKERARRRAEREREAAVKAAARAAERERAERRAARRRALTRRLPFRSTGRGTGRPTGVLARRARQQTTFLICLLVALNALLWFARDDWAIRLAGVVVSVLAAPVLYTLLFRRP